MKQRSIYLVFLKLGLFFTLSAVCLCAYAQEQVFSLELKNASFQTFVTQIEQQSDYTFYYNDRQTDSLAISLSVQNQSLDRILTQVFSNKSFNYSIDRDRNVFVSYGRKLITSLPLNFFKTVKEEEPEKKYAFIVDYFEAKENTSTKDDEKLFEIGIKSNTIQKGQATITGRIINSETGEPLIGVSIFKKNPVIGVSSDPLGYYSLTLPRGRHTLFINSLGMRETSRKIILYSDGQLNIELDESVQSLKEVVVEAEQEQNVVNNQMGIVKMDIKTIKQIPTALGESDVLRVVLSLPGVSSVGEASTGLNVRGGTTDQNLIQLNEATIYNPSHLFGFFSAFNPDILNDVQLYKSSIPAKFGGRLSSVLDITTKEGNKKKFSGSGGIGLVTSRLSFEGPIGSDKTSFVIAGRSNYSNWLLQQLDDPGFRKSKASFYDVNAGVAHQFNKKNSLFFNAYLSNDQFRFRNDTTYRYSNLAASLKWTSILSEKLLKETSLSFSQYDFSIDSESNPVNAFKTSYKIQETNFKSGVSYFVNEKITLDAGINSKYYHLEPGNFEPNSSESIVEADVVEAESALESALYASADIEVSKKLSINAGLRYAIFNVFGEREVNNYVPGVPRSEFSVTGVSNYNSGEIFKTYHGPELRASMRYAFNLNNSVKIGYNIQRQFIQLLSNTAAIAPTDIWKLSDSYIRPQFGQQLSVGFYKNLNNGLIETSIEGYYKKISNYLDYKSGATLIMNQQIETDIINTRSKAYGLEFLLKKTKGKLNGWVSYTYSRSLLQQDDDIAGELINNGEWYPSNFDKPHDFTIVGNYKFSHRFSVSLNLTYSTGRPITLPIAVFNYAGAERVFYSERNEFRIPDYYRADISMNIEGNHKVRKLAHSSWTIAVYNLLGRRNPYSVFFITEREAIQGYQLSIFGRPIPTLTYNFKF